MADLSELSRRSSGSTSNGRREVNEHHLKIITVWYPKEPVPGTKKTKEAFEAFKCQVKKATSERGMLLDHLDMPPDHPKKEFWLPPRYPEWLLGDWVGYPSREMAQQVKAGQRADRIAAAHRENSDSARGDRVWRIMQAQEQERARQRQRETALFRVAQSGGASEVRRALSRGDVNLGAVEPVYKCTALMEAAANNSREVIDELLKALGPPQQQVVALHERTPGGLTALHWAAMCNVGPRGRIVVRRLIDAHAEPSLRTKHGDTALDLARRFKNDEVIKLLDGDDLW